MAIDASGYQFQFYSQGIYSSSQCDSTHLNHAMLIIGYGSHYDDKYWIMKNRYYRTMTARETRAAVYIQMSVIKEVIACSFACQKQSIVDVATSLLFVNQ